MHYYQFNVGDYSSHTQHLTDEEDLAYRRMLDYCYTNEIGLPKDLDEIGRLIRMRTHSDSIANVLKDFFHLKRGTYINNKVQREIEKFHSKSNKAKQSASIRWAKTKDLGNANAIQTQCEGNANHKPLTTNHKPLTKENKRGFTPPTLSELKEYCLSRNNKVNIETFIDFYIGKGWMVGKNKMKDWKACVRTWEKRDNETSKPNSQQPRLTARERALQNIDQLGSKGSTLEGSFEVID